MIRHDAAELRDSAALDEVVHDGRTVPLRRDALVLRGPPPLAVERTVRAGTDPQTAVILVHGFAQNRYTWRIPGRSMVAALAEAGFEVLNVELRGHGLSRAAGAGNATSFAEYVADLERVIDRCARPPFVIGHSLGAGVGMGAATTRTLAGLVHLAGVYRFAARNRTLRALARLTLAAEPALRLAPVRLSTGWAGDLLGRLYAVSDIAGYGFPISGWVPDSMERELLEARLSLGFDWTSVEVWLEMARWADGAPFPYAAAFTARDLPLLVIAGDHDPLVTPGDAAECFADSGASDKRLLVFDAFEHGVHWGHVDLILGRHAPARVWPEVLGWLDARRGR